MVSKRICAMKPSATSALAGRILALKASGAEIAAFNVGEPDFPTPAPIVEACARAMAEGRTKYTEIAGIPPLREAIAEKLRRDNALEYAPKQICVSVGAKQAVYNAVQVLCDPGDEVIIPTPCWVSYVEIVRLAGAVPVLVPTTAAFHLDLDRIAAAITPRTRLVLLNTPNNPTGAVYDRVELSALAELSLRFGFYVAADEVYEKLVYGDSAHVSIASLSPEIAQHTITVNGFSKAYAMTGWRIGYAAGPEDVVRGMVSLQGHCTSNITTFVQWAALTALRECGDSVEAMRQEFERRREYMYERLARIPGLSCPKPEGAFYLMPDVSSYYGMSFGDWRTENAEDLCNYLLREARIAIVPGDAFEAPDCVRISYSASMETIRAGMDRMEQALGQLT